MVEVHVVNVFTNPEGHHGNPLGVVMGARLSDEQRQALATDLNFSETVFVDDVERATLRIFTPVREIPFAGHPLVGTSWFLAQVTGSPLTTLRPLKAAEVGTWVEGGMTWVRARFEDAPPWQFVQLEEPEQIETLPVPPGPEFDLHEFWAWQNEARGTVRARVFASSHKIAEDEATGSGALRLVEKLKRPLVVTQGRGSVLHARPSKEPGRGEVGGHVVKAGVRTVQLRS